MVEFVYSKHTFYKFIPRNSHSLHRQTVGPLVGVFVASIYIPLALEVSVAWILEELIVCKRRADNLEHVATCVQGCCSGREFLV
jgi:fructose-specific phosphotransferase system IIC component